MDKWRSAEDDERRHAALAVMRRSLDDASPDDVAVLCDWLEELARRYGE